MFCTDGWCSVQIALNADNMGKYIQDNEMRYGAGQYNRFIDTKQQLCFALEPAVEDPGQIMEREQVGPFPDPQPESGDSEGSS